MNENCFKEGLEVIQFFFWTINWQITLMKVKRIWKKIEIKDEEVNFCCSYLLMQWKVKMVTIKVIERRQVHRICLQLVVPSCCWSGGIGNSRILLVCGSFTLHVGLYFFPLESFQKISLTIKIDNSCHFDYWVTCPCMCRERGVGSGGVDCDHGHFVALSSYLVRCLEISVLLKSFLMLCLICKADLLI